jgi:hypothetical protein
MEQFNPYTHQMEDSSWTSGTGIIAKNESTIDTLYMPEEWHQTQTIYYYPDDWSFCIQSPKYTFVDNIYFYPDGVFEYGEFSYYLYTTYKEKIGFVSNTDLYPSDPPTTITESLGYARKGGNSCYDNNAPVGILPIPKNELSYSVYPNPANDFINLRIADNHYQNYTIKLINALVNIFYTHTTKEKMLSIPAKDLPNGVYYIHIMTSDGKQGVQKVAVAR